MLWLGKGKRFRQPHPENWWYQEDEKTIKYYTVSNDGSIFSDNKHTINGYKGFYRTITCVPTSEDEFNG